MGSQRAHAAARAGSSGHSLAACACCSNSGKCGAVSVRMLQQVWQVWGSLQDKKKAHRMLVPAHTRMSGTSGTSGTTSTRARVPFQCLDRRQRHFWQRPCFGKPHSSRDGPELRLERDGVSAVASQLFRLFTRCCESVCTDITPHIVANFELGAAVAHSNHRAGNIAAKNVACAVRVQYVRRASTARKKRLYQWHVSMMELDTHRRTQAKLATTAQST